MRLLPRSRRGTWLLAGAVWCGVGIDCDTLNIAMYERLTDRTRKVMQLAGQAAHRQRHEHVFPEHILIGLIEEGRGVAAKVLKNLGVRLDQLLQETTSSLPPAPQREFIAVWALNSEAARVLAFAEEEAASLNHDYVGTEHLLSALLRDAVSHNVHSQPSRAHTLHG